MSRFTLLLLSLGLWVAGSHRLMGFALLGPFEDWQVDEIGYQLGGDLGGPMNVGKEYRRNTPEMFYSFDVTFLDFFGTEGIRAVTNAFEVFNTLARTNVSNYSSNLSEFPTDTTESNLTAEQLSLVDLKSFVLSAMMEQLGLDGPTRWVWALRTREELDLDDVECPANVVYNIIQRNYAFSGASLTNVVYSTEINGESFTDFTIFDNCGDGDPPTADAFEAGRSTAVADGVGLGEYFTGLTQDDVGGLRYLLSRQNVNTENTGPEAFAFVTNAAPQLIYPTNLLVFAQAAATNDALALQALFPGLVVTASSNYFVNTIQTNITASFSNSPYAPVGTAPQLVLSTNYTTNIQTRYVHSFGNVLTNEYIPYSVQSQVTTNIGPSPSAPVGSGLLVTNVTVQTFVNPSSASGSIIIYPAGFCGLQIVSTQLTQVVVTSNLVWFASYTSTNTSTTNGFSSYREQSVTLVDYWTNRILTARGVTCPTDPVALRRGVEKLTFKQQAYDSLLGQLFVPFTNFYDMVILENNQERTQRVGRVVSQPDFRFAAEDLVTPDTFFIFRRNVNFSSNTVVGGTGPGIINPSSTLTFNNVGLTFIGGPTLDTNVFVTQADINQRFLWGSFDATNVVVFPNGTSIADLENQLILQIVTSSLTTNLTVNVPYGSGPLAGQGGTPPYSWSLPPFSFLPPGLSGPNPATGAITGTPTTPGLYDFSIRMTDSTGRFVDRAYTMTINSP